MNPYWAALAGGALIGLSASALLWLDGRLAGVSGIAAGMLGPSRSEAGWRLSFLGGLVAGGLLLRAIHPAAFGSGVLAGPWFTLFAGLLVGFGTQLGSGCTSGHGVCGLAGGSSRSLVAVVAFMGTGALTVVVTQHLWKGALP